MRIAICDDDRVCQDQILSVIQDYITHSTYEVMVSVFENGADLIDEIEKHGGFDIYILDIVMPGINGIQLGIQLRQVDLNGKILYLTSSREYALDAFKAKAFDYILKPFKNEVLLAALNDASLAITNKTEKSLIIKSRENSIKLSYDSIVYAELNKKIISYHLNNGKTADSSTIRTTFSEAIQPLLHDSRFSLCGSSIAVNLYYIVMVETDTLCFKNGEKLYIGKRASREIRSIWSDFWLNGEESK